MKEEGWPVVVGRRLEKERGRWEETGGGETWPIIGFQLDQSNGSKK
jgi:hypothetical protein